jgi:hypothetical protein
LRRAAEDFATEGDFVRILLASAVLAMTAACVMAPPPEAAASPQATAVPASSWWPFYPPSVQFFPPAPVRLTLSNFSYDAARVQILITPYADCAVRENTPTGDFVLPLNGTRIVEGLPGSDVCWRRAVAVEGDQARRSDTPGWSQWNRAYLTSGRSIDARL